MWMWKGPYVMQYAGQNNINNSFYKILMYVLRAS